MINYTLQFKPQISARQSREMLLLFAKYGNHHEDGPSTFRSPQWLRTDEDVKRAYRVRGLDFERTVEHCRSFSHSAPFENKLKSVFHVSAGATVSRVDMATGKEDLQLTGPGVFSRYAYWSIFESAIEARDAAMHQCSYTSFLSAVTQGLASIEAYLTYRAELWNNQHPERPLLDSRAGPVKFDDKLKKWIPTMAKGLQLDKGGRGLFKWEHFKILRGLRDDANIHAKNSGYSIPLAKLAQNIDMFRTGIAAFLVQLHKLFDEKIPAVVIRAAYAPDIEISQIEVGASS